jgi:hypothetical protein
MGITHLQEAVHDSRARAEPPPAILAADPAEAECSADLGEEQVAERLQSIPAAARTP